MRVLSPQGTIVAGDEVVLKARGVGWAVDGQQILVPLDLSLAPGECLAVIGPNGAGKTTLLRLIAGLLEPTGGDLVWGDTAYATLSRRQLARRMAYVPQVRSATIPLTVEQMVVLGRFPYLSPWQMTPGREDMERVHRALATVGLEALRQRPMDALSGGERQAVFVAAALAQEAEVLLLDEPTTHLDARHQLEVAELLLGLQGSGQHSIVLSTHDLNLAARLADRVLALRQGAVVAYGTPGEILRPDRLGEIFDAPFDLMAGGEHPRLLLRLGR